MSYCRWSECDLYAYEAGSSDGSPLYIVHVAAGAAERAGLERQYEETSASALLDRLLWLESMGCTLACRAKEELREEIAEQGAS
jgi:hypothetical protein